MNKIKFSHEYSKMPFHISDIDKTVLMEVFLGHSNGLSEHFVNYDTHIKGKSPLDPNAYYKLPNGPILILLLKSSHRIKDSLRESSGIWTTIRRWTAEKETYYRSLRGKEIEIYIVKTMPYTPRKQKIPVGTVTYVCPGCGAKAVNTRTPEYNKLWIKGREETRCPDCTKGKYDYLRREGIC